MKLKTLSIITIFLFISSLIVFFRENHRGENPLEGSYYIKGFDSDKVMKIELRFKGENPIILSRRSNKFVLKSHKSYPVSNNKVNELMYKISNIEIFKKITSQSNDDLKKYDLHKEMSKYSIQMFDRDLKRLVSFRVGKNKTGKGNYLYQEKEKDIYLSKNAIWIHSSFKDFINRKFFKIKKSNIKRIVLKSKKNIKSIKEGKLEEYIKNLNSIEFDDYFQATDEKMATAHFNKKIDLYFKNDSIYHIRLAKNKGAFFVKLDASIDKNPGENKEDFKREESILQAQEEIKKIKIDKNQWIYQIDQSVYDSLFKAFSN